MSANPHIALYCISLPDDHARRARLKREAEAHGLTLRFIEGADGRAPQPPDVAECRYDAARRAGQGYPPLKAGEHGAVWAHCRALKAVLAGAEEYAMVLEDNALLLPGFSAFFNSFDPASLDFDVIRLETREATPPSRALWSRKSGDFSLSFLPETGYGMSAMLYSKKGARKALRLFDGYYHPVDVQLCFWWRYGLTILQLSPPIARRSDAPSRIDKLEPRKILYLKYPLSDPRFCAAGAQS